MKIFTSIQEEGLYEGVPAVFIEKETADEVYNPQQQSYDVADKYKKFDFVVFQIKSKDITNTDLTFARELKYEGKTVNLVTDNSCLKNISRDYFKYIILYADKEYNYKIPQKGVHELKYKVNSTFEINKVIPAWAREQYKHHIWLMPELDDVLTVQQAESACWHYCLIDPRLRTGTRFKERIYFEPVLSM